MSYPLVSIIIPCYNIEQWISEAIQSALDQSWPNKEIIVIDDGSTDGSLEQIKRFGARIRAETGPNGGGSAARNRGLVLAEGDWIQFLDGDDVMTPTCIKEKMEEPGRAQVVTCCNVEIMPRATPARDAGGPAFWFSPRYDLEYMLRLGPPQTSAPLHRKEHLRAVGGFREDLPCAQDFDLHLRLAIGLGLGFASHGRTGVRIRPREGSISRTAGAKMHRAMADVLLDCAELMRQKEMLTEQYATIIAQRSALLARKLWRLGWPREAASIAARAKQTSARWDDILYKSRPACLVARMIGFVAFEKLHDRWRRLRPSQVEL